MERRVRPLPAAYGAAALLAATFAAGVIGIEITDHTQATASWWPPAGLGALTLMLYPRRWWPYLVVALTAAYLGANVVQGRPVDAAAWLALADIAETILVASLVRYRIGRRLTSVADFGWLLGISFGAAAVAGLGVAATSARLLGGDFGPTLGATTSAHWASVMVILPLGMAPRHRTRGPAWLIAVQALVLLGASLVVFGSEGVLARAFLPLPFLIWAGVSFGYRVVVIEQVVMAALVTAATLVDKGPFAAHTEASNQLAQLYLVSVVIAGLPLALAVGELQLAAAAARNEKRRTEAIIESSTTPIMVAAADGTMLSTNPATTALTGFTATELIGRPFWEKLVAPEDWGYIRRRFSEYDKFPEHGEGIIRTASGGERIVTFASGALVNPDDSTNYVITANDITAERTSSRFLQHLFRSATTVAILGTDPSGTITLVNAGAEGMLRITQDEATGRSLLEFLDPGEVEERGRELGVMTPSFSALVADADLGSAPQTRDWTWRPPDGVELRISMTTSLVADARNRPIGYLFVARDVTETRRNQELLHQALERERAAVGHLRALDHAKDDFVSTVSHELRTPLTSIIGSIELFSDGLLGDLSPDQAHLVEVIERNAERLLALANDLLLLAAYENATPQAPFVQVDLRDVVQASTSSIMPLLTSRDLDVRAVVPEVAVRVLGDAGYLERAVTNLLTNAVKFTPDGGAITTTVGFDAESGIATLSVADTGIGIPDQELAEVFQRFFRSSNVRADAIQGTGLGLSIVSSIVESHRGTIDVASEQGEGTIFTIVLPLA